MTKLAQQTVDALTASLAHDATLRQQAIADPKSFVTHHFELTEAQAKFIERIPEAHWRDISNHISKTTFANGGTFKYVLRPDTDHVHGDPAKAKVETKCEVKAENGPNGTTYSGTCSASCSWD